MFIFSQIGGSGCGLGAALKAWARSPWTDPGCSARYSFPDRSHAVGQREIVAALFGFFVVYQSFRRRGAAYRCAGRVPQISKAGARVTCRFPTSRKARSCASSPWLHGLNAAAPCNVASRTPASSQLLGCFCAVVAGLADLAERPHIRYARPVVEKTE